MSVLARLRSASKLDVLDLAEEIRAEVHFIPMPLCG